MKKVLILISMFVMFLLVVSCAPQEMTDEELQAELAKLTPEERAELLADLDAKESGALAGQGTRFKRAYAGKAPALARSQSASAPETRFQSPTKLKLARQG